ncbi:hypothetical protein [Corynebacterium amycolatum]|nr:hypothetical protein [Corynebacterium amycolatum]STC40683.1 Uncharacterised protein [Corynebacterium amycolatum]
MTSIICDQLLEQADDELIGDMADLLECLDCSDFPHHRPTQVAA